MANCIVVVQFDLPKRSEEQAIKGGTASAPTYRGLSASGLIRKDYLNGDAGTGGVYLWESRKAAEAWFTEAKLAELTERFGARPASHLVRHARHRGQSERRNPRQRQGAGGGLIGHGRSHILRAVVPAKAGTHTPCRS